jgi:thymidylate kinase
MVARLIAIEGADRVGKATQSRLLVETLRTAGKKSARIEIPFNDQLMYKTVYWMLKNGLAASWPNLFQFVQFLNKFLFQIFVLPWYLFRYDYVVFDRWSLSAVVYGDAGGAWPWLNRVEYSLLFEPSATVVLAGFARGDCNEDVYEKDSTLQTLVRVGYGLWVQEHHAAFRGVECSGSKSDVHSRVVAALTEMGALNGL